jgi:hypothetical protein
MKKITLYKWENLQCVKEWDIRFGYSTEFCGRYGFVDCDQGTEYIIPEGFELSENVGGELCWYDSKGKVFELKHYNGRPTLEDAYSRVDFIQMQ